MAYNYRVTALHRMPKMSKSLDIDLWIKRDDLYPVPGGGVKGRKAYYIFRDLDNRGINAVVTTGGIQSNHSRAIALQAASLGWKCVLVLHGNPYDLKNPNGNLLLMKLAGATIIVVEPNQIKNEMENALMFLHNQGFNPIIIPGGGHCLLGSLALVDAVSELKEQCDSANWWPDWIVHASGTGTTQAGILAGIDMVDWPTHVIGISVARSSPRGTAIIQESYEEVREHLQIKGGLRSVVFLDHWIGEGYEKPHPQATKVIQDVGRLEGLPLDPTYTSKAMLGLINLIENGTIPRGASVLFWHTGGLPNLFACNFDSEKG